MFNSLAALFSNIQVSPYGQIPASAQGPDNPGTAGLSFESILNVSVQKHEFRPVTFGAGSGASAYAHVHEHALADGTAATGQQEFNPEAHFKIPDNLPGLFTKFVSTTQSPDGSDSQNSILATLKPIVMHSMTAVSSTIITSNEISTGTQDLFMELDIPAGFSMMQNRDTIVLPARITAGSTESGTAEGNELSGSFVVPVYSLNELFGLEEQSSNSLLLKEVVTKVADTIADMPKLSDMPAGDELLTKINAPMTISLGDLRQHESIITLSREIAVRIEGNDNKSDDTAGVPKANEHFRFAGTETPVIHKVKTQVRAVQTEIIFTGSEIVLENSASEKIGKAVDSLIASFMNRNDAEPGFNNVSSANIYNEDDQVPVGIETGKYNINMTDVNAENSNSAALVQGIDLANLIKQDLLTGLTQNEDIIENAAAVSIDPVSLKTALSDLINGIINDKNISDVKVAENSGDKTISETSSVFAENRPDRPVKLPVNLMVSVPVKEGENLNSELKVSTVSKDTSPSEPQGQTGSLPAEKPAVPVSMLKYLAEEIVQAVNKEIELISSGSGKAQIDTGNSASNNGIQVKPAQEELSDSSVAKTFDENTSVKTDLKNPSSESKTVRVSVPVEINISKEMFGEIAKAVSDRNRNGLVKVLEENAPVQKFFESLTEEMTNDIKKVDITLGTSGKSMPVSDEPVDTVSLPDKEFARLQKTDTSVRNPLLQTDETRSAKTESVSLDLRNSTVKADDNKIVITFRPESEHGAKKVDLVIDKQEILKQAEAGKQEYTVKALLKTEQPKPVSNEPGAPVPETLSSDDGEEISVTIKRDAVQKLMLSRNEMQSNTPVENSRVYDRNASSEQDILKTAIMRNDEPVTIRFPIKQAEVSEDDSQVKPVIIPDNKTVSKDSSASLKYAASAGEEKPVSASIRQTEVTEDRSIPAQASITISKNIKDGKPVQTEGTLVFKTVRKQDSGSDTKNAQNAEKAAESGNFRFELAQDRDGGMRDSGHRETFSEFRDNSTVIKTADQTFAKIHAEKVISTEHVLKMQNVEPESTAKEPVRATWHVSDLADNIIQRTSKISRNSDTEMRIQLIPPHLGKMVLKLKVEDQNVIARVQVESSEAKSIMQDNLPQLREAMNDRGMEIQKFDVDVRQDFNQNLNQSQWSGLNKNARGNSSGNKDRNSENGNIIETLDDVVPGERVRTFGYNTMELTA